MSTPYDPKQSGDKIVTPGSNSAGNLAQSDISRTLPRQISTGTMRGTQNVGYGTAKIDGSNNRITVGAPDGSTVGLGSIPNSTTNEFGFFTVNGAGNVTYKVVGGIQYFYDDAGNLIQKIMAGTTYVYDPVNNDVNVMQEGLLPDGTYGWAVAAPGKNVADGYS